MLLVDSNGSNLRFDSLSNSSPVIDVALPFFGLALVFWYRDSTIGFLKSSLRVVDGVFFKLRSVFSLLTIATILLLLLTLTLLFELELLFVVFPGYRGNRSGSYSSLRVFILDALLRHLPSLVMATISNL